MTIRLRLSCLLGFGLLCLTTALGACGDDGTSPAGDDTADGGSSGASGGTSGGSSGVGASSGAPAASSSSGGSSGNSSGGPGTAGPYPARTQANVLFSGHSLLDPVPTPMAALVQARGDSIGWERQSIPGSPLRVRTFGSQDAPWSGYRAGDNRNGSGRDLLAELAAPTQLGAGQHYDTLTVTERHDPLNTVQWENTVGYLRHFHDRVTEHQAGARTMFYQVWPDIDKADPTPWIAYQSTELVIWECIAGKVNLSLAAEGKPENVVVIPGSQALARLVEVALDDGIPGVAGATQQKLDALFTDNVHLTSTSAYFIAALHYAATYGKSPLGANAGDGVSAEAAAVLEQLAWDALGDYASTGHPHGNKDMAACRAEVAASVCPAFYAIRNQDAGNCAYWSGEDSPLHFPDPNLPLPAP